MISAFTAFITGSSTSSRSADLVNNAIEREVRASASSSDRTLHVVHRTAWEDHAVSAAMVVALTAGTYYVSRLLMKHMSSSTTSTATAAQASRSNLKRLSVARTAQLLSRIGAERLDDVTDVRTWLALRYGSLPSMSSHEQTLLGHVILPGAITASFDDIGGLDHAKEEIFEGVIIPMQHPEIFEAESTSLLSPPRGVLLHGPPGTGKTMMAQAIAKECNCTFINIRMSTVMSMWSGEAQKLISALFSLAELLKPSIIFIDEIDTFLRNRDATMYKSETMESMKTEFFQCWDGMLSSKATQIVVIGATNRPQDIDAAAVRRFSRSFRIGLPDQEARVQILKRTLRGVEMDESLDLNEWAERTKSFSGSDLKEFCRYAAQLPMRELVRSKEQSGTTDRTDEKTDASTKSKSNKSPSKIPKFDAMTQSFVLDESVDSAAESDEEDEVPAITFSSEFSRRYSHLPQRLKVRALCRADFESAFLQIRSTAQRQAKHHTDGIPAQWS